jgi:GNAT superfamily N-acetyltransferase
VKTARGVSIRRATAADLDTVVALRLALLREYQDHPVYGRIRRDAETLAHHVFARQLASSRETFFLAERDGAPVGLMRCVEAAASPLFVPDRYCYLSSVYVRPEHRRHGVLRALFARARDWCTERGLTEMRLNSVGAHTNAAAAWDALGFDVVEQVRVLRLAPSGDAASVRAESSASAHNAHQARP